MATLKRTIALSLSTEGREIDLSGLRVDFEVDTKLGASLDTAVIRVYNLSYETIQWLSSDERIRVKLDVSYGITDTLYTLFQGVIMNIQPIKQFQDHVTTLYCWVDGTERLGTPWNRAVRRTNLRNLIDSMAREAGFSEVSYTAFPDDELSQSINSFSKTGTVKEVLTHLGRTYHFTFNVTGGVLRIVRVQTNRQSMDTTISKLRITRHKVIENFLKKPVSFNVTGATIYYKLNPTIIPSDLLEIPSDNDSLVQRSIQGLGSLLFFSRGISQIAVRNLYQIVRVNHTGSNFTDEWESAVEGFVYSDRRAI